MRLPTPARRAISSTRPPARPARANSPIAAARILRLVAAGSRGRVVRERRVVPGVLTLFMMVTYRSASDQTVTKIHHRRQARGARGFRAVRPTGRMRMKHTTRLAAVALAALCFAAPADAAEKVSFILNWVAGGDHAPYYYARAKGWYA